jgi:hypothetical protein
MSSFTRIMSALVLSGLAASTAIADTAEKLGTVSFANSCVEAVQPQLQRAVALLHSFWWEEGDKSFRDVLQRDPGCAIATWGIATIAINNPFGAGATPAAAKTAEQAIAQGRAIGAKTERERGYIEAIAAYYDRFTERPHPVRLRSLSDAFDALSQKYPDDDETQIFSALYLAATQNPTDKSFSRAMRAASILKPQFAKHPDHPGVAHYLIHSYDYPPVADQGLDSAMCYADIAPVAPHALHMPSHIFTRVGLWEQSAATNQRSVDAAKASGGGITDQLHAYDYMIYADLQLARDTDARRIIEAIRPLTGEPGRPSDYARAAIPARYAIEREQWREAAQLPDPDASKFPYTSAIRYFGRALGAARSGDPVAAEQDVARLQEVSAALKAMKGEDYWVAEVEVQVLGAEAWIAYAKGSHEQALKLMREAADKEDLSEKSAVSPGRLVPARELLGDMLRESGEAQAALAEYEASQTRDPRRFRSLWGAAQAAAQAGDSDKARRYYAQLVKIAGDGNPRPELAVARNYLAAN